jgi:hypothetical protein
MEVVTAVVLLDTSVVVVVLLGDFRKEKWVAVYVIIRTMMNTMVYAMIPLFMQAHVLMYEPDRLKLFLWHWFAQSHAMLRNSHPYRIFHHP